MSRVSLTIVAAAVAACAAAAAPEPATSGGSPQARTERAAAQPCRTVVRIVRGQRRRVRVCTKRPVRVRNVALRLAAARAASATVGPAGGTVAARAADGTAFTLTIPAGALLDETSITLTPVSALRGLAGIRLRAGVQFGPDGLALARAATLTIVSSKAAGTRALAWWAVGRTVSRYPSKRSGARVRIAVTHFSGVGIATGPDSAWAGVPDATAALRARWSSEVAPRLAGAATREPDTSGDFEVAFSWARTVSLLGLEKEFAAELQRIFDVFEQAVANAIGRAETRCKSGHDFRQIERLTRLDRIAQLFGLRVPGDGGFARALECARFALDIDFHVAFRLVGQPALTQTGELRVRAANVILEPGSTLTPQGARALEVTSWQFTHVLSLPPVMSCTGGPAGATSTKDVQATLQLDPAGYETRGRPDVSLLVDPGDVQTMAQVTCNPGGSQTEELLDWDALWKHAFSDRATADGRLLVPLVPPLGSWVGGDVLANYGPETRTVLFGSGAFGYDTTVTWSMTLRHAPAS